MNGLFMILFGLAAFGAAAAAYEIVQRRETQRELRERHGDDLDRAKERRRRLR